MNDGTFRSESEPPSHRARSNVNCQSAHQSAYPFSGILEAEFYEIDVEVIPITFPFATSHIWWPINQADELNIKFDFRSNRTTAVLAYGEVTTSEGNGFWEVSTVSFGHISIFVIGSNVEHYRRH